MSELLLNKIGTSSDVRAMVIFKGDDSVGISDSHYELLLPNGFQAASDDEEVAEWIETTRKKIADLYFELEQDRKVAVWFEWELLGEAEWERNIDALSE